MPLEDVKEQVFRLSPSDRLTLANLIVESLQQEINHQTNQTEPSEQPLAYILNSSIRGKLRRNSLLHDAETLFQKIASGQITRFASATTLTAIFYIARRQTQSIEHARQAIAIILSVMEIYPVDHSVLEIALASTTSDFEDAVQIACASVQGLDAIVTRDAKLSTTSVPVLSVSQVVQQVEAFD